MRWQSSAGSFSVKMTPRMPVAIDYQETPASRGSFADRLEHDHFREMKKPPGMSGGFYQLVRSAALQERNGAVSECQGATVPGLTKRKKSVVGLVTSATSSNRAFPNLVV